jgi:hypothetical protein
MLPLPLSRDINRCLAHDHIAGQFCERANDCARHVSIRFDIVPVPAQYRCCSSDLMAGHIPLAGFPPRDEDDAS